MTWAILGCGYVGERLLAALRAQGKQVIVTTRRRERAAELGPEARVVDPRDPEALAAVLPARAIIVDSVPADPERGPHLDAVVAAGEHGRARRIVYLSATSVYGADAGGSGWIDEDTAVAPDTTRGRARLAEEERLLAGAAWTGIEAVSLRIAAIYGPGRGLQERIRAGTYQVIDDGAGHVSRIHVDDLVQVILAAATVRPLLRSAYVVGDDQPTTSRAHADAVAACLGLPPPPSVPRATAPALAVEMQTGGRRIRNERLKSELGVTLRFPTWREGLAAILRPRG